MLRLWLSSEGGASCLYLQNDKFLHLGCGCIGGTLLRALFVGAHAHQQDLNLEVDLFNADLVIITVVGCCWQYDGPLGTTCCAMRAQHLCHQHTSSCCCPGCAGGQLLEVTSVCPMSLSLAPQTGEVTGVLPKCDPFWAYTLCGIDAAKCGGGLRLLVTGDFGGSGRGALGGTGNWGNVVCVNCCVCNWLACVTELGSLQQWAQASVRVLQPGRR